MFGGCRARAQPRRIQMRVVVRSWIAQQRRPLGVREQGQPQRSSDWQREPKVVFTDVREFVDPRWTEKALEPKHAGLRQRLEIASVARDDTAPESDVDVASARRRVAFGFKRGDGGGWRNAV